MSSAEQGKPEFDPTFEARVYGQELGMTQGEGEPGERFRLRVAGELRRQGRVVEAHEAYSGRRYDDPDQGPLGPMAGIFGAAVQALSDRGEYSPHNPERQLGDDLVAGGFIREGGGSSNAAIAAIFDAFGPEAGMDVVNAFRPGKNHPQQ